MKNTQIPQNYQNSSGNSRTQRLLTASHGKSFKAPFCIRSAVQNAIYVSPRNFTSLRPVTLSLTKGPNSFPNVGTKTNLVWEQWNCNPLLAIMSLHWFNWSLSNHLLVLWGNIYTLQFAIIVQYWWGVTRNSLSTAHYKPTFHCV